MSEDTIPPEVKPRRLRLVDSTEVQYRGETIARYTGDMMACPRPLLARDEKRALLLSLLAQACEDGIIAETMSVDETLHALQMIVDDPF